MSKMTSAVPRWPLVIATGPSGFPGASQIMCGWLRALANAGASVHVVATSVPFAFQAADLKQVTCHSVPRLTASALGQHGAVGSVETLRVPALAEQIVAVAEANRSREQTVLLWGTYLFPYSAAAYLAAQIIRKYRVKCHIWMTPTGSDIWELGPQLVRNASFLLSAGADKIITYSRSFADEIRTRLALRKRITVLTPLVDQRRFRPLSRTRRATQRRVLGIGVDDFVICHHSNLRPIKRPRDILAVAAAASEHVRNSLRLLMLGPADDDLQAASGELNLRVAWLGVVSDAERYLRISDVELNLSLHDSFNLSLAEAMSCGLPVVSTSVVGIADHINAARAGFLVKVNTGRDGTHRPANAEAVAALRKLAASPSLRESMSIRASAFANDHYAYSDKLIRMVRRVGATRN